MYKLSDFQQNEIRKASGFVRDKILPLMDDSVRVPVKELFLELAAGGYHALLLPEKHGGRGVDYLSAGLVYEELSYACVGLMPSLLAAVHCGELLKIAEADERRDLMLDLMGRENRLYGFCLTEEDAGSDITSIKSSARKSGDSCVINGVKTVVINCGIADYYIVIATGDHAKGRAGLNVYVVDAREKGVQCVKVHSGVDFRYNEIGAVKFENAKTLGVMPVGGEGSGYFMVMETFDKGRPLVAACCTGAARKVFDIITAHAKKRHQFGKELFSFQGVSFKLADLATRIRASRLLYLDALSRIDEGAAFSMEASMAKLFASETLRDCASFGLEVLGSRGFYGNDEVHDISRAANLLISIDGSSNVQRMVIASQI